MNIRTIFHIASGHNEPAGYGVSRPVFGLRSLPRQLGRKAWAVLGLLSLCIGTSGCQTPSKASADPSPCNSPRQSYHDPLHVAVTHDVGPLRTVETVVLGTSNEGRDITMTLFGREGETTLILGGFHGNEPTSATLAHDLVDYLRRYPHLYQNQTVAIVPEVNPDGLRRGTRTNAGGVDVNRNFPARNFPRRPGADFAGGRTPASEPETCAVLEAVRQTRPGKIISIHSIRRGRHGNNFDGPAENLAAVMSRFNGYPVLPTMGYPTPGSFGSWAGVDRRIPTITLELPRDASESACWQENREALLAAIRWTPAPPIRASHLPLNSGK